MAKLMAPNIRIDWYPEGHFADIQNPTVAELNSGYNLSCAIVTGYTLDFTDSNTEDTTTIFDDFTSESILNHSYEADLQFFLAPRDSIAGNEEAYRKAEELFYVDQNPKGYLAKRFGFPGVSKYVGNQKVDLFLLQADLPKVLSEEDNPVLLNIRFLPQGEAVSGVTVLGQLIKVTAVEPAWKDSPNPYLKGGGTWSTPAVEGVIYDRPSGTAKGGETITVSARPKTGYELSGSTSWSHTFPERLPWVSYEWEGEPHNSPSIKKVDGQVVARNLLSDPDFKGDLSPAVSRGDYEVEDSWLKLTSTGSAPYYSDQFTVEENEWAVFKVQVKWGEGAGRARLYFQFRNDGGSIDSADTVFDESEIDSEDFVFFSAQAPAGTTSARISVWFYQEGGYSAPDDGDYGFIRRRIVATGDTEEAALEQVETYFDGDTPDEYL